MHRSCNTNVAPHMVEYKICTPVCFTQRRSARGQAVGQKGRVADKGGKGRGELWASVLRPARFRSRRGWPTGPERFTLPLCDPESRTAAQAATLARRRLLRAYS